MADRLFGGVTICISSSLLSLALTKMVSGIVTKAQLRPPFFFFFPPLDNQPKSPI